MSASYTLQLTDGTPLTDITSLESNGVGNQSTPRRILDIDFSTSPPKFVVGDDATLRFVPNFSFTVFDSAYDGEYTVAPAGSSFLDGVTSIPVNEPIALGAYTVLDVSDTTDYWKVTSAGNDADIFYPTSSIMVAGNSFPAANASYTVVSAVPALQSAITGVVTGAGGSWTINGVHSQTYDVGEQITVSGTGSGNLTGDGNYTIASKTVGASTTTLVVTGTIPAAAVANGSISATIPYTKVFVTAASIPTGATATGTVSTPTPSQFAFSAPPAIVVSSPNVFDITWRIAGDHTSRFTVGGRFNVKNNSYYDYHVFVITAKSFSGGNTHVTGRITGTTTPTPDSSGFLIHPIAATQKGYIQYEVPVAASSLQLIGKGAPYFNNGTTWGYALMNNSIHQLEQFADNVPPAAPLQGQIWYDQTVDQHRVLAPTATQHPITAVNAGTKTFTIAGNYTTNVEFQAGKKIEVYNNTGLGIENHEFTVASVTLNGANTDIVVVEVVASTVDVSGTLYGHHLWNGMVTATIPTTNYVDMNGYPIVHVEDIPAAHEYTIISGDTPFDNDFQANALNLRSANLIYVNVTGDTMTGDLTMATGVDINMTNGNINMNAASALLFPVGSTGDIVMSGANDIDFAAGSTGDIFLRATNDINFPVGSTGDVILSGANDIDFTAGSTGDIILRSSNDINFPTGSTGDVILNGGNDILMAGTGRVDLAANELRMNSTSFVSFPAGSTGDIVLSGANDINFPAGSTGDIFMRADNDLNFPAGSTGDITVAGANDLLFAGTGRIDLANNEQRMNGTSYINFPVASTGDIVINGANDINFAAGSTGDIFLRATNDINFPTGSTGDILLNGGNDILVAGTGRVDLAANELRMNSTSFVNFPVGSTGDVTLQGANDIVFSGTGIINMGNNKITNLANATVATDALNMQTGDARYVNVTGDTMTGALSMTSANITMTGTSTLQFTGTGQVDMGTNKVVNLATPTTGTDATNKAYVDAFVSGIVFLTPVKDPNVYNDVLSAPPLTPQPYHRTYLVKPAAYTITGRTTGVSGKWIISGNYAALFAAGNTFIVNGNSDGPSNGTYTVASATDVSATTEITITGTVPATAGTNGTVYHSSGAWNGLDGRAVSWNGTAWVDILGRAVQPGDRFGVYMEPDNDEVPIDTSGMGAILIPAAGKVGTIQAGVTAPGFTSLGTAPAWSFYTPVEPDAVSVTGQDSLHFGHSYTFRGIYGTGTYNSAHMWIEFSGPTAVIDGAGLKFTGNILNIGAGSGILVSSDTVAVDPVFVAANASPDIDINTTTKSISTTPTGWNNVTADYGIPVTATGVDNISLGRAALHAVTSGSNNIAVGSNAMWASTLAADNVAIGRDSLYSDPYPIQNIAIGAGALRNYTSTLNLATEIFAGGTYTIASVGTTDFTLVGASSNTVGVTFVATGTGTGTGTVVDGIDFGGSVAIGYQAMYNTTSDAMYGGTWNTAVGYQTMYSNTSGYYNTTIGYTSMWNNTTGYFNTAVGFAALGKNTTGNFNAADGTMSMYRGTTGSNNTAMGYESLFNNTTGSNNTIVGYQAGRALTTGSNNTLIGGYQGTAGMAGNVVLSTGDGTIRLQHDGTNWTSATPISTTGLILPSTTSTITLNGSVGTTGQVLTSAGAGATPTWKTLSNSTGAPVAITPPASTVAYQNTTAYPMQILVQGGTVTLISISRDNTTYYDIGVIAGAVMLAPNDYIKLTYSVAPTMTGFPQ